MKFLATYFALFTPEVKEIPPINARDFVNETVFLASIERF